METKSIPQGRATMHQVARLAGVSLKTVSRVVNREPGVSETLTERVTAAMRELGYRHNLAASNLRRGQRTASIGVLLQDISNQFCSDMLRGIEDVARAREVVVIAASVDESADREHELVGALIARRIDGLILMPASQDQSYLRPEVAAGLEVVVVDRRPTDDQLDSVTVDNQAGARDAVEHLLAHGHRRIAFLGDSSTIVTATDRRDGYRAALAAAGLEVDPELIRMDLRDSASATAAAAEMLALPEPPTALFTGRNEITNGAFRAIRDRGLQSQVALIGFDDFPGADLYEPAVTVVTQDVRGLARTAIEQLLKRLDGHRGPAQAQVLPTRILARGSGEIPA